MKLGVRRNQMNGFELEIRKQAESARNLLLGLPVIGVVYIEGLKVLGSI